MQFRFLKVHLFLIIVCPQFIEIFAFETMFTKFRDQLFNFKSSIDSGPANFALRFFNSPICEGAAEIYGVVAEINLI